MLSARVLAVMVLGMRMMIMRMMNWSWVWRGKRGVVNQRVSGHGIGDEDDDNGDDEDGGLECVTMWGVELECRQPEC